MGALGSPASGAHMEHHNRHRVVFVFAVLAALALCVAPTAAPQAAATSTGWQQQHPVANPDARSAAAMAYDDATRQVVLFGGQMGSGPVGDTWVWSGSNWTQSNPG